MDLSTKYLGLDLEHPLVPSASPLTRSMDLAKRLEDAGAPALVMYSLFEEQIRAEFEEHDAFTHQGTESFGEALSYLPAAQAPRLGPDEYLEHLFRLRGELDIPIIASLNGLTPGGWTYYAAAMEGAGASAVELNLYSVPTRSSLSGAEIEAEYLEVVRSVKEAVRVPVAVKLSPYFSNLAHFARGLVDAGADGLVLFNRFYQPDIDLEALEVVPNVQLSTPTDARLGLRWIAILRDQLSASLAATGGVHGPRDALKLLMAGADVTMMCGALLRHGPEHLSAVVSGMHEWLEAHEYESVAQLKGSMSYRSVASPERFERAHYMQALNDFDPPFMRNSEPVDFRLLD